jgi:hypothetical protein
MYPLNLQRSDSQLGYLRYNAHQVHRRHNLPNSARHLVPDVVPAARLKHVHSVDGLSAAAHDRLGRFQAVVFSHIIPPEFVANHLFVCCPAIWWNYLGS